MSFDYQKVCQKFFDSLLPKQKEVIERRFGLKEKEPETLEKIGQDFGVSRERIRQIQDSALIKIKKLAIKEIKVFNYLQEYLKEYGGLRREENLLFDLGREKFKNYIYFLLHLEDSFERKKEDEEFYTLWFMGKGAIDKASKVINFLENYLAREEKPFSFEELLIIANRNSSVSKDLSKKSFYSFLEVTKKISQGPFGDYGLTTWVEITPRGIKDKAYLVLKREKTSLHFRKITDLINYIFLAKNRLERPALPQTVHNELIKDKRFVLVGRGIYALREWGFEEGTVKDLLVKILRKNKKGLLKDEILREVKKQRLVKETTILLNLSDKNLFEKTKEGKYRLI
jgi:hypothetical protein